MKAQEMEPWLADFVEQKTKELALLITERAQEKIHVAGKLCDGMDDDTLIALLPLPSRLIRALRRGGVETIGDLSRLSESDLRRWRHVGPVSLDLLRKFLALAGRTLPPQRALRPRMNLSYSSSSELQENRTSLRE